jgi:hypothetical protein
VTLREPDGGSGYYAHFTSPKPTDWFPIAEWAGLPPDPREHRSGQGGRVESVRAAGSTSTPVQNFVDSDMYGLFTFGVVWRVGPVEQPWKRGLHAGRLGGHEAGPPKARRTCRTRTTPPPMTAAPVCELRQGRMSTIWENEAAAESFVTTTSSWCLPMSLVYGSVAAHDVCSRLPATGGPADLGCDGPSAVELRCQGRPKSGPPVPVEKWTTRVGLARRRSRAVGEA